MQVNADALSRRGFLGVAAGAALAASGQWRPSAPRPRKEWLIEPRRLYSQRGVLAVTLEAAEGQVVVDGRPRQAFLYDGSAPAPTLVVDPGDRIMVRLVNRLADSTNFHTHGFHVSPGGNS